MKLEVRIINNLNSFFEGIKIRRVNIDSTPKNMITTFSTINSFIKFRGTIARSYDYRLIKADTNRNQYIINNITKVFIYR